MPYYENVFNRHHHHYTDISFLHICFVICHKSSDVPALMIVLGKTIFKIMQGKKSFNRLTIVAGREKREKHTKQFQGLMMDFGYP